MIPRRGQKTDDRCKKQPADVRSERSAIRAVESEAHAAIFGHPRVKATRAHDDPGQHRQHHRDQCEAQGRRKGPRRIGCDAGAAGDQPSLEDLGRAAVILERGTVDRRAAVEVSQAANFSPRRIDSQRQERRQQVDDPDAKVLASRRAEFDLYFRLPERVCGAAHGSAASGRARVRSNWLA